MPKCHVCGKKLAEGEGFEHDDELVCCDNCKDHYEENKGSEDEEKGEVCEFC